MILCIYIYMYIILCPIAVGTAKSCHCNEMWILWSAVPVPRVFVFATGCSKRHYWMHLDCWRKWQARHSFATSSWLELIEFAVGAKIALVGCGTHHLSLIHEGADGFEKFLHDICGMTGSRPGAASCSNIGGTIPRDNGTSLPLDANL